MTIAKRGGDKVKLEIVRDGKKRTVEATLERRPSGVAEQQQP